MKDIELEYKKVTEHLNILIKEHKNDDDEMYEIIEEEIITEIYNFAIKDGVNKKTLKSETVYGLWELFEKLQENKKLNHLTLSLFNETKLKLWSK